MEPSLSKTNNQCGWTSPVVLLTTVRGPSAITIRKVWGEGRFIIHGSWRAHGTPTGGHLAHIPSLCPHFAWVHTCVSFLPLSDPPVVYLPPLLPSLGPGLCVSFQLPLRLSLFRVFFFFPTSCFSSCHLPASLSLSESSDLAFSSSLFRSLPLQACLYGCPSAHTSPPSF